MLSRRILTISLLITGVSGYFAFFSEARGLFWLLGVGIVGAMLAYVFQHQLNWWWYSKHPPAFPAEIESVYMRSAHFYQNLTPSDRETFRTRARLFVEAKEFIAQGFGSVAEEIKYIIAYYAVAVSFYRRDYLFSPYDRIVLYLHPFLSPNIPDRVHAWEIEHDDGTLIFSLEQLTAGFLHPDKYFQTGFHLFSALFAHKFLSDVISAGDYETLWTDVAHSGVWTQEAISDFTGIEQNNPVPVLIHHWFVRSEQMRTLNPQLYTTVSHWLSGGKASERQNSQ